MLKKTAFTFSVIFHPVFLFFYIILILFLKSNTFLSSIYQLRTLLLLSYIILNTIVIPIILIYIFRRDLLLKKQEDRTLPFFVVIITYVFVYIFLKKFELPEVLLELTIALVVSLLLLSFLNRFQKISLHAMAASNTLVFFFYANWVYPGYFSSWIPFIVIWAGLMGSSRLVLKAHSEKEVWFGYLLGILCSAFIYII